MKSGFRQSMAWLHTWVGLLVSWLLYFIFLTGTLGYFDSEIDQWMSPETPVFQVDGRQVIPVASKFLLENAQKSDRWRIYLPVTRSSSYLWISYQKNKGKRHSATLNPYTGEKLVKRSTAGGQTLYKMHYRLRYLPRKIAYYIVGICTMFMLLALVTGVVVHKKIFKDFFTFRRGKKPSSWLDGHNALSVMSLPFHFMITLSGLLMLLYTLMPLVINAHYGFEKDARTQFFNDYFPRGEASEPTGVSAEMLSLEILYDKAQQLVGKDNIISFSITAVNDVNAQAKFNLIHKKPSDSEASIVLNAITGELISKNLQEKGSKSFYHILLALHEGLFANTSLRWLYFLSGILGTGMIASGMILWTVKRRNKAKKNGGGNLGYRMTEGINVASIIGLPIAIGAYFLANRLLPLDIAERAAWEINCLFIVWGLMTIHGILRAIFKSADNAWVEQLNLAAAVFLLIPLISTITAPKNLFTSLVETNWVFISIEIISLLVAFSCLFLARYLAKLFRFELVNDLGTKPTVVPREHN
ncbi:MAG: PepSY-associated TM helix domain-containing protein [Litorilituus sp.]|nr:PepSY-associated TM helix domain-containing protein [Litorilituus sp.]